MMLHMINTFLLVFVVAGTGFSSRIQEGFPSSIKKGIPSWMTDVCTKQDPILGAIELERCFELYPELAKEYMSRLTPEDYNKLPKSLKDELPQWLKDVITTTVEPTVPAITTTTSEGITTTVEPTVPTITTTTTKAFQGNQPFQRGQLVATDDGFKAVVADNQSGKFGYEGRPNGEVAPPQEDYRMADEKIPEKPKAPATTESTPHSV